PDLLVARRHRHSGAAQRGDAHDRVEGGGGIADEDHDGAARHALVWVRPGVAEVAPDIDQPEPGQSAAVVLVADALEVGAEDLAGPAELVRLAGGADLAEVRGELDAIPHEREDGNELTLEKPLRLNRADERRGRRLPELLVPLGVKLRADALPRLVRVLLPV